MSLWTQTNSPSFWQERSAFVTALVLAGLLHAVLLLSISFGPEPQTQTTAVKNSESESPGKPKSHTKPLNSQHTLLSPEPLDNRPVLTAESLQQQISQLGERIRTNQPVTNQKVKHASSVSNHRYLAAQYVQDWENKVEHTGNLNYPEAARHKREAQILTMSAPFAELPADLLQEVNVLVITRVWKFSDESGMTSH